jgi:predicted DNA-binding transcriptional regulator YafY
VNLSAADRQLCLLEYLASNRRYGVTRIQIGRELGVVDRTVRRYVARLRDRGWDLVEKERDDGARVLSLKGMPPSLEDVPRG